MTSAPTDVVPAGSGVLYKSFGPFPTGTYRAITVVTDSTGATVGGDTSNDTYLP